MANAPNDQLINEFKNVSDDAESLLKATASQAGSKIAEVRKSVEDSLSQIKPLFDKAKTYTAETTKAAVETTDSYVRENPWTAVGAGTGTAFLLGLALGVLIARR
jgi:ElaB/YqjD/DUF883 family membrane-anchored ribosome-binding protein